jgi:hypothetical protein
LGTPRSPCFQRACDSVAKRQVIVMYNDRIRVSTKTSPKYEMSAEEERDKRNYDICPQLIPLPLQVAL